MRCLPPALSELNAALLQSPGFGSTGAEKGTGGAARCVSRQKGWGSVLASPPSAAGGSLPVGQGARRGRRLRKDGAG